MLLYWAALALSALAILLVLPSLVRCLPDCCRSCQLRWSRSSEVRPDLIAAMRFGRPASTPALARDVLEYVAVMRRGLAMLSSRLWLVAGALFVICGGIWAVEAVRWHDPALAPSALFLVTYPLATWRYMACLAGKLDRAEAANADLAQRPDLYLVRSVELDCISN